MKKLEKSTILIGIGMFLVLFFAVSASGSGFPPPPPGDISGKVCYTDDTPVVGASVTLINRGTGDENQTTTDDNGRWCVFYDAIGAKKGDEILITVSVNGEEKSKTVNLSGEPGQEVPDFVFDKQSEVGPPGLPSDDGDGGSASVELPEEEVNVTEEEKGAENVSEQQPSPSPSPSEIKEKEKEKESVAGKGEGETPLPTKEGDKGEGEDEDKDKSIPGFQILYAGAAGLIAIAGLFIIRKLRLRGKGGVERR